MASRFLYLAILGLFLIDTTNAQIGRSFSANSVSPKDFASTFKASRQAFSGDFNTLKRRSLSELQPRRSPKSSKATPNAYGLTLPDGRPFNIGTPSRMTELWVDPSGGNDNNSGNSRSNALRTLAAAWNRIPQKKKLSTGFHIRITAGTLRVEDQPNYWEYRWGTKSAPIIIEGADPGRKARLSPVNIYDTRFIYFINVSFDVEPNDPVHCEKCVALLIRDSTVTGKKDGGTWETIKVNQCTGVYIENSDVSGAGDNAIDMVAVRFGHIIDSKIHDANWCIYHKGGAAHHVIARNEIYDCGESGYSAGQGTGLEFMVAPWIRYEAYDIRVINNVFHDVWGAALGVWGGQNILYAYNTLYKVGKRSHTIEVNLGDRQCDGNTAACAALMRKRAWGTTSGDPVKIPNLRVIIANNIIYNPSGYRSEWQHIQVQEAQSTPSSSNVPGGRAAADNGLVIRGNIFWNGPADMSIGLGDSSGCANSNPTCNEAQLIRDNEFNTINLGFSSPNSKPSASDLDGFNKLYSIPNWSAWDGATGEPRGATNNAVPSDKDGNSRSGQDAPGAYARA